MRVGYARVSSSEQDTALQVDALRKVGVYRIYQEKRSARTVRPELERMLDTLRPGDVVVVYKFDRFARSLPDLLRIVGRIRDAGASFMSLTESIDTSTPVGEFMMQTLGAAAQFELSMIRERCQAGRAAAVARGVRMGRPPKVDVAQLPALMAQGLKAREIAEIFDCDRSSVAHWIRRIRPVNKKPA